MKTFWFNAYFITIDLIQSYFENSNFVHIYILNSDISAIISHLFNLKMANHSRNVVI